MTASQTAPTPASTPGSTPGSTPVAALPPVSLVLGGARSGKSAYAEALAEARPGPCIYLATGAAGDAEMAERIARHRARRGARWRTEEEPLELARTLQAVAAPGSVVLVDCLTLWLSNVLLGDLDVENYCESLVAALPQLSGPVIFVANEVGLGIVPDNPLARRFRDEAGRLNQAVAAAAQSVVFMAAGLPLVLKRPDQGGAQASSSPTITAPNTSAPAAR